MKIDIKVNTNADGTQEIMGWDIIPENKEDENTVCIMRDAIYFGLAENRIVYAGRRGDSNNEEWPIDKLMYRREKYKSIE